MIYSIGYGNRSIEAFIQLLKQYEIRFLLDVRSKPYSRIHPDFAYQTLQQHIENADLKYVYMGKELGGQPDDPTCYTADGRVDYELVKAKEFYTAGIQRLVNAQEGGHVVVLMCAELRPEECHRSKLIGETLRDIPLDLLHITETGNLKRQDEVIVRQMTLFGDTPSLTSKGRYAPKKDEDE
jgi:uncharacterized protein (DUF488 family)